MPDLKQIPLSVPAADLGVTVDALAERLGAEVVTDALGLRCCSPSVVRRLMEQREHAAPKPKRMTR